jgi:hypothetical protein
MADNNLNYDASTVNSLLAIVDENKGAFPLDSELSATSEHAVTNKTLYTEIKKLEDASVKNKGYFKTEADLLLAHPTGDVGEIAYIGTASPYAIYAWGDNGWEDTGETHTPEIDLNGYPTKAEMTEIKTDAESAATRAEAMASYTDAASEAATKANEAAAKAEEAAKKVGGVNYMHVFSGATTSVTGTATTLSVDVEITIDTLPSVVMMSIESDQGSTSGEAVVTGIKTADDEIYGSAFVAMGRYATIATKSYTGGKLTLSVSCTFSSTSTSKSLSVGDIGILY